MTETMNIDRFLETLSSKAPVPGGGGLLLLEEPLETPWADGGKSDYWKEKIRGK